MTFAEIDIRFLFSKPEESRIFFRKLFTLSKYPVRIRRSRSVLDRIWHLSLPLDIFLVHCTHYPEITPTLTVQPLSQPVSLARLGNYFRSDVNQTSVHMNYRWNKWNWITKSLRIVMSSNRLLRFLRVCPTSRLQVSSESPQVLVVSTPRWSGHEVLWEAPTAHQRRSRGLFDCGFNRETGCYPRLLIGPR